MERRRTYRLTLKQECALGTLETAIGNFPCETAESLREYHDLSLKLYGERNRVAFSEKEIEAVRLFGDESVRICEKLFDEQLTVAEAITKYKTERKKLDKFA